MPNAGKAALWQVSLVMPAYNAERTLRTTLDELPELVDVRILVDDHSSDRTVEIARNLMAQRPDLHLFIHNQNYGYGRNQQTCYREALAAGADVVGTSSGVQIIEEALGGSLRESAVGPAQY